MSGRRHLTLVCLVAGAAGGCGHGTVTNDDAVSRSAAEATVERLLAAVHDGRYAAACAQLPGQQRGGLARLSASRGGPQSCEGALRTLREFAPARRPGALSISHDMGFRGALPHRSKAAIDDVAVDGRQLGSIGLRRVGETWSVAVVCDCP